MCTFYMQTDAENSERINSNVNRRWRNHAVFIFVFYFLLIMLSIFLNNQHLKPQVCLHSTFLVESSVRDLPESVTRLLPGSSHSLSLTSGPKYSACSPSLSVAITTHLAPSVSSTTDCTTDCKRREGQEPPDLCGLKFTANQ